MIKRPKPYSTKKLNSRVLSIYYTINYYYYYYLEVTEMAFIIDANLLEGGIGGGRNMVKLHQKAVLHTVREQLTAP